MRKSKAVKAEHRAEIISVASRILRQRGIGYQDRLRR